MNASGNARQEPPTFLDAVNVMLRRIETLAVPVIAAVNGLTRAGGFELLLACDLAIAADDARIRDVHSAFGMMPGGGSSHRLPRRIGPMRAAELIMTSRCEGFHAYVEDREPSWR